MKHLISTTLLLLALLLPATANAYDFEVDGIYYLNSGNEATVTYKSYSSGYYTSDYNGEVTIPRTVTYGGSTYPVTAIDYYAFRGCRELTSVTIPNTVTYIGEYAFSGCSGLTNITIPNSVTSIEGYTFYCCSGLTNITIPNSITSIGDYAFYMCSGLTNITIPNSVTTIGRSAFRGCSGLTSANIPNSITTISDHTFYDCSGLTSITIPNSVTTIEYDAFGYCEGLKSVIIGNSVTTIEYGAFYDCKGLTSIDIPNSVTTIGNSAFAYCNRLTNINIPSSVTSIGYTPFRGCSRLNSINVASGNTKYDSRNNCNAIIETTSNSLITGCQNTIIPNSVTSICDYAFYRCNQLTSATIPNSVITIGDYAFSESGLSSVTIPNSVTSIGNDAFRMCTGLRSVTIPNSVTFIGDEAFYCCSGLTSVDIPNSVTSIGDLTFYGCRGLTSVNIPNSVTSIGEDAFCYCRLTSVTIPNSVKSIGNCAFSCCSWLTSIIIPNSVTSMGNNVFNLCGNISDLIFIGENEWQGGAINCNTSYLYIDSRITSIKGIKISPKTNVYCYATTPTECDATSFTDYSATLHVPATSLAAYFSADYWCNFANIIGDAVEPNITISQDSVDVILGTQFRLIATVTPNNATPNNITWKSTNNSIATVNNGMVTTVGVGECDIIAQCLYKEAICHVVVNNTTMILSLDQQEAMVLPNHMITLIPSASPILPDLAVTSSEPTVAAARVVNDKVQVVGIKEGTAIITVGSVDGMAEPATCIVTVYTERGDVNCDGFVNISDVTALIDVLLGGDVNHSEENADCNNDGKMTISDVTALIDALLGGAPLPEKNYEVITVNGVTFKMIKVQGGTFTMGATPDHGTEDPWNDEWPTHEVTVSSFSIGQTEVTQELWQAVMGSNPSYFTGDANRPVETVSWDECQQFIATLNQLTGMNFRMPTEAEWEYAARGGNMTGGYKYAGSNDINEIAWWNDNACDGVGESSPDYGTHPVALKKANELGLYDMSGNVWEWCQDWYGPYSEEAQINPTGPETGTEHLHRGGSWINYARNCRVSCRFHWVPDNANYVGLRLVK